MQIKDVYNDKNIFFNNLTHTILKLDLLDDGTKEKLSSRIRREKIFTESDYETLNLDSTISEGQEHNDDEYNIILDKRKKRGL